MTFPDSRRSTADLWPDDTAIHHRLYRRVGRHVFDRHLQQIITRLQNIRALGEDGVAIATGVHEVIGHEADSVSRPDRRELGRRCPSGAFHMPVITGVDAVARESHL